MERLGRVPEYQPTRTLWVKAHCLELIRTDQKTLELRPNYPSMQGVQPGTFLIFNEDMECMRFVTRRSQYKSLEDVAEHEDLSRIDPTIEPEELLQQARGLFNEEAVKLGFSVFELGHRMPE
ncbi:MAG: hypothetical protein M1365_07855 [Actinobacteria bacterium]|nr:hypothetical protein [Actinomycetota bacterium]